MNDAVVTYTADELKQMRSASNWWDAVDTLTDKELQSAGALGNLDSEEQDLISRMVYELNMRFIRVRRERQKI